MGEWQGNWSNLKQLFSEAKCKQVNGELGKTITILFVTMSNMGKIDIQSDLSTDYLLYIILFFIDTWCNIFNKFVLINRHVCLTGTSSW